MATSTIKCPKTRGLTITRTENVIFNATSVGRLRAYERDGINVLEINLIASDASNPLSDFTEIARISGWSGVWEGYLQVVDQTSTTSRITIGTMYISTSGTLYFYSPNNVLSGSVFRGVIIVPWA